MILRKIGCFILAIALSLPLTMPINSYAASRFSDTDGHWAESYINTAVDEKIITGYPDGRFQPDKAVTRAEFAVMVNKALGNTGSENLAFSDVTFGQWYYNDVSKAVAAAYTAGYDDNTFRPNNAITRQEAAVMISRIVPTFGEGGNLRAYSDYRSIADWAYDALEKINGKGYIGAYSDGKIHPTDKLTRAQTAKIICDILDHETIVTNIPNIDDNGTKLSGRIYANGVTIDEDLGEDSATIENCVILGNLSVRGGGVDTITISNSRVANATVSKDTDPVRVLAKGETAIAKISVSQSSVLQTSSLSGGLFGPGFSKLTVNGSAEVDLRGNFPNVNVSGARSNVTLESGTIDTLTVGGRYSNITAASGTTIKTATVNAESYFHGSGTISKMFVNADEITYETKPKSWTIASSADTPTRSDELLTITYSPKNGATKVNLDTKITITFNLVMEMYDGSSISNSDIEDFVELREDTSSGNLVGYSATINNAKTIITITPDSVLTKDTRYYVIIDKNSIRDNNENGNAAQSVNFTTGNDTQYVTTAYSPANGAATVPANPNMTVTFSEAVVRYSNGTTISSNDAYLKNCIVFRKNGSTGEVVPFSASIDSSKRVITIYPTSSLTMNQKYYVAVVANTLRARDGGEPVPSSSVTWTTGVTIPVLSNFSVSPGDTSVTATMTPNVAGRIYAVVVPFGSTAPTSAQIAAGQNSSGVPALASARNENVAPATPTTLSAMGGLASGVAYDVWATLYSNAAGSYSTPSKQSVTTTMPRVMLNTLTVRPIIAGAAGDNQISFNSSTNNYTVGLNSSITGVEIKAEGDSTTTITLTGNGLGTMSRTGVLTTVVDIGSNPTLTVTVSSTGKTSSSYTINLNTVSDTSLKTLRIAGSPQSVGSSNFIYALPTSEEIGISLDVTTNDKYAVITAPTGSAVTVNTNQSDPGSASFFLLFEEGSFPVAIEFNVISGSSSLPKYTVTFSRP